MAKESKKGFMVKGLSEGAGSKMPKAKGGKKEKSKGMGSKKMGVKK